MSRCALSDRRVDAGQVRFVKISCHKLVAADSWNIEKLDEGYEASVNWREADPGEVAMV